jgi:hypothetical protein
MKRIHLIFLLLAIPAFLAAQGVNVPARTIVDLPNASTLPNASFDVTMRIFPEGGLLTGVNVGLNERFMIGISYGGVNIIGKGDIDWNPFAGAAARYRILSESFSLPGIAIGFDSQGHGAYVDSVKRFERKSPGFFVVSSKNYRIFEGLSIHLGANFSLEDKDEDKGLNVYTGAELNIRPELAFMVEYDFALNDNSGRALGEGKGFLNVGLRYTIKDAVFFEIFLFDVLENFEEVQRAIRLTYLEFFRL